MRISGFTIGKNVHKLYYPIKQAIESILPIVDEFVVALGDSDEDDKTHAEILSIGSDKIKIVDTVWDIKKYPRGMEHAHQTDIAKSHCSGDWLFYLQSDEVIHEKYLPIIQQRCKEFLDDREVEGMLFDYLHFWGDYDHFQDGHCWYRKEIRIIRNLPQIHSWESAQSFRKIPDFDQLNYRQQENTFKLKVVDSGATVYHYGWVRPPALMQSKIKVFNTNHQKNFSDNLVVKQEEKPAPFDYGNLNYLSRFQETHPLVMKQWMSRFDWKHQLRYSGQRNTTSDLIHKHEKTKYRIISWIEKNVLFNRRLGEFKNYILLKR
jgi:hypothetical protein